MCPDRDTKVLGGCMCGEARYLATGEPLHIGYCHCRSCRHHSGAAVAGMLVFRRDRVRFTKGRVSLYTSSPGVQRGFCGVCGTTLTWQARGLISLHIGALDDPDRCAPTLHWRYKERSPWYEAAADLPCVEMVFPADP